MRMGMVGLGRMGANMTRRLLDGGHEVAVYDISPEAVKKVAGGGAIPSGSLGDLASNLEPPRVLWIMVPAGDITNQTISQAKEILAPGDILIDGGNSRYTDSVRHAEELAEAGIHFADAGTSGGVWGLEEGYCLMVGAEPDVFDRIEPILETLAPDKGYVRTGPPGSGHFVKMVHNGIEYALMQAYAEGFEILEAGEFDLDLPAIAEVWRHGSVIRSWLLDLAASALAQDPHLQEIEGYVEDSGEGRWTVESAIQHSVPAPTIALSLFARFASRQQDAFSNRLLAALRKEFGGHAVRKRPT